MRILVSPALGRKICTAEEGLAFSLRGQEILGLHFWNSLRLGRLG